jgi:high-affinity nickel-transport protein
MLGRAFVSVSFKSRAWLILTVVVVVTAAAWAWALSVAATYPILIGSAALAYGLGLRHALDADHIAAIDNVTRRLIARGQRPAGVGFFFSLGHSTVVVAATVGAALAASQFKAELAALQSVGGWVGTAVSTGFLLFVATLNILVLVSAWHALRHIRTSSSGDVQIVGVGLLARMLGPALRRIGHSAWMYPLGLLFGLGFDTATEIGLLGLSAAQAAKGLPIWTILMFPALFTSAMALIDTAEALFMMGAYSWAESRSCHRLRYNLAVTALSALLAVTVGLLQLGGLLARLWPTEGLRAIETVLAARAFEGIGVGVTALFAVIWLVWIYAERMSAKSTR